MMNKSSSASGSQSSGGSCVEMSDDDHLHPHENTETAELTTGNAASPTTMQLQLPTTASSSGGIKPNQQKQQHQRQDKRQLQQQQQQQQRRPWSSHSTRCFFLLVIFSIHSLGNVYNTWIMEQFLVISNITVSKQRGSDSVSIRTNIVKVPLGINAPNDDGTSIIPRQPSFTTGLSINDYILQNTSAADTSMIQNLEFAYTSVEEMLNRPNRFPSVEHRIKVYMSNWYTPPCDDNARIAYQYSKSSVTSETKSDGTYITLHELSLQQQQDEVIENEKLNHKERRIFRVNLSTASSLNAFDAVHYVDRDLFLNGKHQYQKDIVEFFLPSLDKFLSNQTGTDDTVPILYQFGDTQQPRANQIHFENGPDKIYTQSVRNPRFPVIQKVRTALSKDQLEGYTDVQECYQKNERLGTVSPNPFNNAYNRVRLEPIILKLKTHRHYGHIYKIAELDTVPWIEKKNMAIFRGALTGSYPDGMGKEKLQKLSFRERCRLLPRCWVSFKHASSQYIDSKLTESMVEENDGTPNSFDQEVEKMIPRAINLHSDDDDNDATVPKVELFGDKKTIGELLQYKALVLLEGNDISSGLKWALFSNSVVMMPEPTLTSWAMEELLLPWVHYVPINVHKEAGFSSSRRNSKTDVEEKMQWILNNEDKAQQIVRASTLWIADLVLHPDEKMDESIIFDEVAKRYLSHFVPSTKEIR